MTITSIISSTRRPDISFYRNGCIEINARVARQLALSSGDVIDICRDGDEYFLCVRQRAASAVGRHTGAVYQTNRGSHHFRTSSVRLCRALFDLVNCNKSVLRLACGAPIQHNNNTIIPLITKLLL